MTRQATVVETPNGLKAQVIRSEACAKCGACRFGQTEEVLCDLPEGDFKPGDSVDITLSDHALTLASLLAYGVPLIALVIGLALGHFIFESEILQALTAALCALIGLVITALGEKKRRRSGKFDCTAHKTD